MFQMVLGVCSQLSPLQKLVDQKIRIMQVPPNDFEYYSQSDTLSQQKESKSGHLRSSQAMQERLRKITLCSCANLSLKQETCRERNKNRTRPNTINYVM